MLLYIRSIIIPYVEEKRKSLGLSSSHSALVIFDEFNGQTSDPVLRLLEENNIFYVIVPPNCTDRLQPLDVSINKPAKEFLQAKFQAWYANKIQDQIKQGLTTCQPIDLNLSIMKPIGARWIIELSDYFKSKPNLIISGFKNTGIVDAIKC